MHFIRAESFVDASGTKEKDILRRINENLEITMARSRQARRKSELQMLENKTFLDQVNGLARSDSL